MVKKHIALQIILEVLFGKSSNVYKELSDNNLILGTLGLDYEFAEEYAFLTMSGCSREPKKVIERLNEEIKKALQDGINEADFSRIKRKLYGDYIAEYNDVENTARMFFSDFIKGINSFEYLDKYDEITKDYADEVLRKTFDLDKEVYSIVTSQS